MPQASTSLNHRNAPLSVASEQLRILNQAPAVSFAAAVESHGFHELRSASVEILQVNVGKLCNMTCRHCHVDAGPDRREIMTRETIDECLSAIRGTDIHTLDLTGGAPEMNPDFRYIVTEARRLGVHVIDRCNLTILLAKGYEEMAGFLAEQQVEIVASLPCYLEQNTDNQRGDGAYRQSIEALQLLNQLGYGQPDSDLKLTLVFNPVGPSLPPEQTQLEQAYRDYLRQEFQIEFNRLFTITNMPISRYLEDLLETGQYESYMQKLIDAFNPAALAGVMCRQTLSVSWDGQLYDCDFNQMLELPTSAGMPQRIGDFDQNLLKNRQIAVGQHCFGCTAGSGSSCQGAIA